MTTSSLVLLTLIVFIAFIAVRAFIEHHRNEVETVEAQAEIASGLLMYERELHQITLSGDIARVTLIHYTSRFTVTQKPNFSTPRAYYKFGNEVQKRMNEYASVRCKQMCVAA